MHIQTYLKFSERTNEQTKTMAQNEINNIVEQEIKTRLREMLKATVEVESTVGVGTKVLVKIPKNDETRLEEC